MKITKSARERAAQCAAVLACTPNAWTWEHGGFDAASLDLAWEAFTEVRKHYLGTDWWASTKQDDYAFMAEAEALLRTGWTP